MTVEAVIFDWGGTLTPWHTIDLVEPWRAWARVAHPDRFEEVAQAIFAAENEVWARARTTGSSGSLAEVLVAAGVGEQTEALAAYHAFWEPHTLTDPDVPELFAGLRSRGIRIGVLSNTLWPRDYHESVFRRDGVLEMIDAAVYTSEIDWTKPHPEAFQAALVALGVSDPARAVFVGDRLFDDIHGAKAVGMRAVLVPHSDIPDSQRGWVDGQPDAVVQRLGEVVRVVDRWLG